MDKQLCHPVAEVVTDPADLLGFPYPVCAMCSMSLVPLRDPACISPTGGMAWGPRLLRGWGSKHLRRKAWFHFAWPWQVLPHPSFFPPFYSYGNVVGQQQRGLCSRCGPAGGRTHADVGGAVPLGSFLGSSASPTPEELLDTVGVLCVSTLS